MNDTSPLDTLAELAREARDSAAKALADDSRNEQQVATQVETLAQYRHEYALRLQQAMHAGIDTARLRNYQQFLHSLDTAWQRACQVLEEQRGRVTASRDQWRQQQQRLSSYDTLAQRRAEQVTHHQQRRELRQQDEITARIASYGRQSPWGQ